ncbi:MAG: hypothetical protein CBC24_06560 [Candidatus Pelagibacter sp. TMED64]|nr:hypothetical protein [Candidatus Pelagibacter sp.]OUU64881.1 MAG: hypothetical protein CBC24_06560 [Candidatus Pelagibacter sp. TMED64]|tara:strand:- start:521 stop:1009 length:489 start_codon:yes stop_codon:yes gene_type:complete
MKLILLTLLTIIIFSCGKRIDGVYWCGDHACINEKERLAYFQKTMIIEVRKLDGKKKKDLVDIKKSREILIEHKEFTKKQKLKNKILKDKHKSDVAQKIEKKYDFDEEIDKTIFDKDKIASLKKKDKNSESLIIHDDFEKYIQLISKKKKKGSFPDINDFPN